MEIIFKNSIEFYAVLSKYKINFSTKYKKVKKLVP